MLSNILIENGLINFSFPNSSNMSAYEHNKDGYFEDVKLTLLNDQIIRAKYGQEYSFLFPPQGWNSSTLSKSNFYSYDLDDSTILIPPDFDKNIYDYTNNEWDVWGLTRMLVGGKWHKAYSKYKVDNIFNILSAIEEFRDIYNENNGLLIKDPRMIFSFTEYKIINAKMIFLTRDKKGVVCSCRNHYGPKMFDTRAGDESFPYASNHFNLKVKKLSYCNFEKRYEHFKAIIKANFQPSDYVDVSYNGLLSENSNSRKKLEAFLGKKLNWDKVRNE